MIETRGKSSDPTCASASGWSLETLRRVVQDAVDLKTRFQAAVNQSIALRDRLKLLETDLNTGRPPQRSDLRQVYAAAGIQLPELALRRFEEVEIFYDSVNANRRAHLAAEAAEVRSQAEELEQRAVEIDRTRSEILGTLAEQGGTDFLLAMLHASLSARVREIEASAKLTSKPHP